MAKNGKRGTEYGARESIEREHKVFGVRDNAGSAVERIHLARRLVYNRETKEHF